MTGRVFNVLILCTGNSARSILGEALIRHWGGARFHAYSAGSHPTGTVNPLAITLLQSLGFPTEGLRSKSWDEFSGPDAPALDFVFTVCDSAAGEICPVWFGDPVTAHWGLPDPAAAQGDEVTRMQAFRDAFRQLENRVKLFTSLPLESLSRLALKQRLDEIGRTEV